MHAATVAFAISNLAGDMCAGLQSQFFWPFGWFCLLYRSISCNRSRDHPHFGNWNMDFWVSAAAMTYLLKPAEIYFFSSLFFCCNWREQLLYRGKEKRSVRNRQLPAVGWTSGMNGVTCWSLNTPRNQASSDRIHSVLPNFAYHQDFACFLSIYCHQQTFLAKPDVTCNSLKLLHQCWIILVIRSLQATRKWTSSWEFDLCEDLFDNSLPSFLLSSFKGEKMSQKSV